MFWLSATRMDGPRHCLRGWLPALRQRSIWLASAAGPSSSAQMKSISSKCRKPLDHSGSAKSRVICGPGFHSVDLRAALLSLSTAHYASASTLDFVGINAVVG
jgi:hypothetical protein